MSGPETRLGASGDESLLAVLSLGPGAGDEEIRTAYRRLAKRLHPDSSKNPETAGQFERVVRAYKLLQARPRIAPRAATGPNLRYRAVIEAGEDLFALGQVLASDPDSGARELAARRLGLSGRTAAYVFLRRALYDSSPAVASAAVRSAALLGARQAEGEVAALYSRSNPELRRSILDMAAATREPLFRATIEAALRDTDRSIAARAASIKL
jgi:curved DNA-binding protein CbpA